MLDEQDEKAATRAMKATVKWFNDAAGFGFLSAEDGLDYFVHYHAIQADEKPADMDAACKSAVAHLASALRENAAIDTPVEALNALWERVHENFGGAATKEAVDHIERTLSEMRQDYAKKDSDAVAEYIRKALACLGGYYYRTLKDGEEVEILAHTKTFQGLKATRIKKC